MLDAVHGWRLRRFICIVISIYRKAPARIAMHSVAMKEKKFSLGSFSIAGCAPFAGLICSGRLIAVSAFEAICRATSQPLTHGESVFGLLQNWNSNLGALRCALSASSFELERHGVGPSQWVGLEQVRIHAPVLLPRQIFCVGANYRQHVIDLIVAQGRGGVTEQITVAERREWAAQLMDERARSSSPYAFSKIPSTVSDPLGIVSISNRTREADWEIELGVIIGRAARYVSFRDAYKYVAGYTVVNDLTCRDHIYRHDIKLVGTDWIAGKCAPGFLPMGPYLVPAAFIDDPQALQMTLKLNGAVMQSATTAEMVFGIARQIEYLSGLVQLWPGDLICTGSPSGNGAHHGRFLRDGDVLEATIQDLGTQRIILRAEACSAGSAV